MRGAAHLSPIADMPLAFLNERIGVACLADLWRIELQCGLPCRPFRLYPDAPLAHLIGTLAKQGWGKGETSLGSPPILRLGAFASASPLANQKWNERCSRWTQIGPLPLKNGPDLHKCLHILG